jgi:death-on-curing protein
VFSPRNAHAYTGAGLFACAALYAERISRSQAFLDGNKRKGLHAALLFLAANGQLVAADPDLEDLTMALTLQELDVAAFAAIMESRSLPSGP